MKKKIVLTALLLIGVLTMTLTACGKETYSINTPTEALNANCGKYESPIYEVVDTSGEFMGSFVVRLKEVKDPDGKTVEIDESGRSFIAADEGAYTLHYSADSRKVKESSVTVNFKKLPPEVMLESVLPEYYFNGQEYSMPSVTFSSDANLEKSSTKLYYSVLKDGEKTEVLPVGDKFKAAYDTGFYHIVIHAEGDYDNAVDQTHTIPAVVGPKEIVPEKIAHFDEAVGVYQMAPRSTSFAYSTEVKYGSEAGSLEILFDSKTASDTRIGELKNLFSKSAENYDYLVYNVFNPNDYQISVYCHEWFGVTPCAPNAWTRVEIPVSHIVDKTATTTPSQTIKTLKDLSGLEFVAFRYNTETATNEALPKGAKLNFSSIRVENVAIPEPVEGKIGYFDHGYGRTQLESAKASFAFTDAVKYETEVGSTAITLTNHVDGDVASLTNLMQKDVSEYDYIVFRVYVVNNTVAWENKKAWIGVKRTPTTPNTERLAQVSCVSNTWTEIKIKVRDITSPEDVSGLTFRCFNENWGSLGIGSKIYLSALCAEKEVSAPEEIIEGKIAYFDEAYGTRQVVPEKSTAAFSTDVKYGEEAGSTEMTLTAHVMGEFATLSNLIEKDVTKYDYLVFRVYIVNKSVGAVDGNVMISIKNSPTDSTAALIQLSCAANAWTELKLDVSKLATPTDITGLSIRCAKANWSSLDMGSKIYLSAMYGIVEEPAPEEIIEGKIAYFDEAFGMEQVASTKATAAFSTAVKYGEEVGSTEMTLTAHVAGEFAALSNLIEKDVTKYDYLVLRVYQTNAENKNIQTNIKNSAQDTTKVAESSCAPNAWTTFKLDVSKLTTPEDISGLSICCYNDAWGALNTGSKIYLSAMYGKNNVVGKVADFDEDIGTAQVTPMNCSVSYTTAQKYGEGEAAENGSVKFTVTKDVRGLFATLKDLSESDMTGYDYIVFRVYNGFTESIDIGVGSWERITKCEPGVWTEVKVTNEGLTALGKVGDLNGLGLFMKDSRAATQLAAGTEFYLSAIYGKNN